MRLLKLAGIGLVVLLTGCASGVKYSDMATSISTVKPDQGRVYFFRSNSMVGAAIQPAIHMDEVVVGESKPGGFFYIDTTPGNHKVSTATEVERTLTFTLDVGETKYVKTSTSLGLLVGHVTPELVSQDDAMKEIPELKYTGTAISSSAPATTIATRAEPAPVAATPAAVATVAPVQTYTVPDTPVAPTPRSAPVQAAVAVNQPGSAGDFKLGVSSNTVERLARQSGCDSTKGATLVSENGPVENYKLVCEDGKVYVAHCELRQCSMMQYQ